MAQHELDLVPAQDDGDSPLGLGRGDSLEEWERRAEDVAIQEEECGAGLVLGARADVVLVGEVGEERPYRGDAELVGMPLSVELHESPDPPAVRLLGARAVMAEPHFAAQPIEQLWILVGTREGGCCGMCAQQAGREFAHPRA